MLTQSGAQDCFDGGLTPNSGSLWFALFGTTAELTNAEYVRIEITGANWRRSTGAPTSDNRVVLTWPQATSAAWAPISSVRLYSAATGGAEKVRATLAAPVTIAQDSQARINLNQFVLRFTIV